MKPKFLGMADYGPKRSNKIGIPLHYSVLYVLSSGLSSVKMGRHRYAFGGQPSRLPQGGEQGQGGGVLRQRPLRQAETVLRQGRPVPGQVGDPPSFHPAGRGEAQGQVGRPSRPALHRRQAELPAQPLPQRLPAGGDLHQQLPHRRAQGQGRLPQAAGDPVPPQSHRGQPGRHAVRLQGGQGDGGRQGPAQLPRLHRPEPLGRCLPPEGEVLRRQHPGHSMPPEGPGRPPDPPGREAAPRRLPPQQREPQHLLPGEPDQKAAPLPRHDMACHLTHLGRGYAPRGRFIRLYLFFSRFTASFRSFTSPWWRRAPLLGRIDPHPMSASAPGQTAPEMQRTPKSKRRK